MSPPRYSAPSALDQVSPPMLIATVWPDGTGTFIPYRPGASPLHSKLARWLY